MRGRQSQRVSVRDPTPRDGTDAAAGESAGEACLGVRRNHGVPALPAFPKARPDEVHPGRGISCRTPGDVP